jgi:hypothetical protein
MPGGREESRTRLDERHYTDPQNPKAVHSIGVKKANFGLMNAFEQPPAILKIRSHYTSPLGFEWFGHVLLASIGLVRSACLMWSKPVRNHELPS